MPSRISTREFTKSATSSGFCLYAGTCSLSINCQSPERQGESISLAMRGERTYWQKRLYASADIFELLGGLLSVSIERKWSATVNALKSRRSLSDSVPMKSMIKSFSLFVVPPIVISESLLNDARTSKRLMKLPSLFLNSGITRAVSIVSTSAISPIFCSVGQTCTYAIRNESSYARRRLLMASASADTWGRFLPVGGGVTSRFTAYVSPGLCDSVTSQAFFCLPAVTFSKPYMPSYAAHTSRSPSPLTMLASPRLFVVA